MLVLFGLQLVDRSFGPVLPLHLGQLGYSPSEVPVAAGMLFSVLAFAAALGNQLSGRVLKYHPPRMIMAWAALMAASALAVFTVSTAMWSLAASMAVVGLGIGTSITTAFAAGGRGDSAGCARHRVRFSHQCIAHRRCPQPGTERAARRAEHPRRFRGRRGGTGHPGGRSARGHGGAQPASRISALGVGLVLALSLVLAAAPGTSGLSSCAPPV